MEKVKSDLLMSSKPRYSRSTMKLVIVFLFAFILGNLLGNWMGFGEKKEVKKKRKSKEDEWEWFGLAKYWREH